MRDLEQRLARLGRVAPSPRLDARVAAAITAAERRDPVRRRFAVAAAVAAAGAVAVVLLVWTGLQHGADPQPPPVVVELPASPGLVELLQPVAAQRGSFWERPWASLEMVGPVESVQPLDRASERKERH